MMKIKKFVAWTVCLLLVLTAGCARKTEIQYTNLTEEKTQQEIRRVMTDAGITEERQKVFFDHVEQFNAVAPETGLTQGWEAGEGLEPRYDPYDLEDRWMEAYPDFMGYNCRITAFSLFGDFVSVPEDAQAPEDAVMFDRMALDADDSAFPGETESFAYLYAPVPTDDGKNISVHVENLQKEWKMRGIVFHDDPHVRLISVVFHDLLDEQAKLFVGHTGLLFPTEDGLYFVEKLAFQMPYQCTRFSRREELRDYLMNKYDVDEGQPMASPFIMENDQWMEEEPERT